MDIVAEGAGLPTEKQDLRVVKTRRNIEDTFLRLLRDVPFERITVKMVVEEALVNKGTFYRHYLDKYDLAEKAAARVVGEVRGGVRDRIRMAHETGGESVVPRAIEPALEQIALLEAMRGVTVGGEPVAAVARRALMEEVSAVLPEAGVDAMQARVFVALGSDFASLAMASEEPVSLADYLRAARDAVESYLAYLGMA